MSEYESPSSRLCQFPQSSSRPSIGHNARLEHLRSRLPQNRTTTQNKGESYFDIRRDTMSDSPTASLVADLSQNFHLGASPAVPTPRRSLMAQFSLNDPESQSQLTNEPVTPYDDDSYSSPGEMMDTSPLPTVGRRTMVRSISMFEHEAKQTNPLISGAPSLRRPRLTARQAYSSAAVPNISEYPSGRKTLHCDKENEGLADQFEESPRKSSVLKPIQFLRPKQPDVTSEETQRRPLGSVPANVMHKRLPQFRRTQSMVTKNDDFLEPELLLQQTPRSINTSRASVVSPISPEQSSQECQILPSFGSRADQMRRISGDTLARVLGGAFQHMYDDLVIIDCRFPHEYSGGHIPEAINISSLEAMDNHALLTRPISSRTLIVLHCEYSAHRAPRIALHLRNRDRMLNAHRYPALFYPEVYILDGGYSLFFREHRHLVGSMGYVEMNDPTHKPFASKQMHDFRKHTKFQRTQSYTFGQNHSNIGGEIMQREESFKLMKPSVEFQAPHFLSAPLRTQSALHFDSASKIDSVIACPPVSVDDDSFGDSSMMDVDDPSMTSPLPNYANTACNNFTRTHVRSSSGRIDPRRLSSF